MKPGEIKKNDATVNVDGSSIKRIREQQSLTQLYVAKVVGVTTDTISRWENNRYPAIKRVNAQKLADALEVNLEEILRSADTQAEQIASSASERQNYKIWLGVALIVGCAVALIWFWLQPTGVMAERQLPSYASPGAVVPVKISLQGDGVRGVVRETLPPGWTFVAAVPPPSSIDTEKGLLRWIVQLTDAPLHIYYVVKVSTASAMNSLQRFDGAVVVHTATGNVREALIGANQLVVAHIHWADLNGDGIIDDDEMLEAASLGEAVPSLPLDLDSVEELWIEEHYHWSEQENKFLPTITTNPENLSSAPSHSGQ